jgi:hypothetical protein
MGKRVSKAVAKAARQAMPEGRPESPQLRDGQVSYVGRTQQGVEVGEQFASDGDVGDGCRLPTRAPHRIASELLLPK